MDFDIALKDVPMGDAAAAVGGGGPQGAGMTGAIPAYAGNSNGDGDSDEDGDADGVVFADEDGDGVTNALVGPVVGPVPQRFPKEVVPATPFAGVYRSRFTLNHPSNQNLHLLQHVNCSYLSTPNLAPTITQLKQHAQSLVILIKQLTTSTLGAPIDNRNLGLHPSVAFNDGETYDFLNDLRKPYKGPEDGAHILHHNMPQTNLINLLEEEFIEARHGKAAHPARINIRDICPLQYSEKTPVNQPSLPYATHQTLISHANEVLELLDHEYSAKGGLLSILPTKDEKEDREAAESTILGQLILYIQRLVQRVHDLERCYANAMDVIAGEAVVPHQALSKMGPDARQGRELVYPQDRFILVNAGNDLYGYMSDEFDRRERVDEAVMANYKRMGLTGEALWENRGGREYSRGIVAIDVNTRYYRLKHDPLKTIFVLPAHAQHPNTKVTRDMESQPTVVSVVKPIWPERQSTWELKHRGDLDAFKKLKAEHAKCLADHENYKETQTVMELSLELAQGEARKYKQRYEECVETSTGNNDANRHNLLLQMAEVRKLREELNAAKAGAQREKDQAEKDRLEISRAKTAMQSAERDHAENLKGKQQMFDRFLDDERKKVEANTADAGKVGTELAEKLRNAWMNQIQETAVINAYLEQLYRVMERRTRVLGQELDHRFQDGYAATVANAVPSDQVRQIADRWGQEIVRVNTLSYGNLGRTGQALGTNVGRSPCFAPAYLIYLFKE